MPITKKWLKGNTNNHSYEKGESIAKSQSIKIEKAGKLYSATVYGTYPYEVVIDDSFEEPETSCSCPYDWGGLCKHILAVGLEILAGNYKSIAPEVIEENEKHSLLIDDVDFYKNIYEKATPAQKRAFLKQLFLKNRDLRAQFVQFLKEKEVPISNINIIEIRDKVNAVFEIVDLDLANFYENAYHQNDYYDEGEGGEEWAMNELKTIFKPYFLQAKQDLQKNKLLESLTVLLGVYEGVNNVEPPYLDGDYGSPFEPEDYDLHLQNIFKEQLSEVSQMLENMTHPEASTIAGLNFIIGRYNFYTEHPDSRSHPMVYNFRIIEPLFLALLNAEKTANHLLDLLKSKELTEEYDLRRVIQKIADLSQNDELWLETAEKTAGNDANIAIQLLTYYLENEQTYEFYKTARRVFDKHSYELSKFLLEEMNSDDDLEFYLRVLKWHTKKFLSIPHYNKLRELATTAEKNTFIESISKWETKFLVQILEIEERYDRIFSIAKKYLESRDFIHLIQPVVSIFPEKCFTLITEKHKAFLVDNRGRDAYRIVAKELKILAEVESLTARTKSFARLLIGQYSRLRVLKEELKFKGLI